MEEVRGMMGNGPVYISFDIDGLDSAFAPGTGKIYVSNRPVHTPTHIDILHTCLTNSIYMKHFSCVVRKYEFCYSSE